MSLVDEMAARFERENRDDFLEEVKELGGVEKVRKWAKMYERWSELINRTIKPEMRTVEINLTGNGDRQAWYYPETKTVKVKYDKASKYEDALAPEWVWLEEMPVDEWIKQRANKKFYREMVQKADEDYNKEKARYEKAVREYGLTPDEKKEMERIANDQFYQKMLEDLADLAIYDLKEFIRKFNERFGGEENECL